MNELKDFYTNKIPFAVTLSNEITGTVYSMVYRDRILKVKTLSKDELLYFLDIRKHLKKMEYKPHGIVYEYRNFKNKLDNVAKHVLINKLNV
jgi:hypothetical protein